jgi:hypothetical protein
VTNPITGSVTGSSGSTTGNAATATALQTARNINGVSFNGTADITVAAAAGTLTGTTLASGVTASSLTSVGTLSTLTVSGNTNLATSSGRVIVGNTTGTNYKLESYAAAGNNGITVNIGSDTGTDFAALDFRQNTAQKAVFYTNNNNLTINTLSGSTIFQIGSSERMRLDASGNLGLGVTPNASWGSNFRAMQYGTWGSVSRHGANGWMSVANNVYWDNSDVARYTGNFNATWYLQRLDGQHQWYNAASGTAGNAISFTQAMTLDASGNLGVGTASPSTFGIIAAKRDQTADTAITVSNNGTAGSTTTMSFAFSENGGSQGWLRRYRDGTGVIELGFTNNLVFAGNVTGTKAERMRLDASGNLGIGTTPSERLHVAGNVFRQNDPTNSNGYTIDVSTTTTRLATLFGGSSFAIRTGASGTDRLFLDSSGNLGIGTTPSFNLHVGGSGTVQSRVQSTGSTGSARWQLQSDTLTSQIALYGSTASGIIFGQSLANLTAFFANGTMAIGTPTASPLVFGTNDAERARIDSSGRFGIGTSSPDGPLQVSFADAETNQFNVGAAVGFLTNTNTTNNNWAQIFWTDSDGGPAAAAVGVQYTDHTNNYAAISLSTRGAGGLGERVRVKTDGQVRFVPLASAPTNDVQDGDVYYDSGTNKLRVRAGGAWVDLH